MRRQCIFLLLVWFQRHLTLLVEKRTLFQLPKDQDKRLLTLVFGQPARYPLTKACFSQRPTAEQRRVPVPEETPRARPRGSPSAHSPSNGTWRRRNPDRSHSEAGCLCGRSGNAASLPFTFVGSTLRHKAATPRRPPPPPAVPALGAGAVRERRAVLTAASSRAGAAAGPSGARCPEEPPRPPRGSLCSGGGRIFPEALRCPRSPNGFRRKGSDRLLDTGRSTF